MRISKSHILFFVMGLCVAGLCFVALEPEKKLLPNQMKVSIGEEEFNFTMNDLLLQKLTHEMKKPCDMSYGLYNQKRLYVDFELSNEINNEIDVDALKNAFKEEYSDFEVYFGIPNQKIRDKIHTRSVFITIDFRKYNEGSEVTDGKHGIIVASVRHLNNDNYLYKSSGALPFVIDKENHSSEKITNWFVKGVMPKLMPYRRHTAWVGCI